MVTREQSTAEILGELVEQALAVIAARESRRQPVDRLPRRRGGPGRRRMSEVIGERLAEPSKRAPRTGTPRPPAGCCAGCARSWPARAAAQERLDRIVRVVAAEMVAEVCSAYVMRAGEVLELFATEGLRPEAVHRTRLRVGEGLVGAHRRERAPAGARRRAGAPRFRLPPGDRRGDLSLADGRADPARRPRARRPGGAEPDPAPLHRGRDRDRADDRDDRRRADRQRRAGQPARDGGKPASAPRCRCGSGGHPAQPGPGARVRRCCTSRAW